MTEVLQRMYGYTYADLTTNNNYLILSLMTELFNSERSGQEAFFTKMGVLKDLEISHYTDGKVDGVLFEFKRTIEDLSKPLSEAVNYLSVFRLVGEPVPGKIALVDIGNQISGGTIYLYDSYRFRKYINRLPEKRSSICDFIRESNELTPSCPPIHFEWHEDEFFTNFYNEHVLNSRYFKVTIDPHNAMGWARYYFTNCRPNAKKTDFIGPNGEVFYPACLKDFIEPYTGSISDFKEVSDTINPKQLQKQIGAYFTPSSYCEISAKMVESAVERLMNTGKFNDYVIIDRCAGTGNLERKLPDDILEHVILNTIEPEEWRILKNNFSGKVRGIYPTEISYSNELIVGANAMDEDFIFNTEIMKYVNDEKCAVIIYENPPYLDGTSNSKHSKGVKKTKNFVSGQMTGNMGNESANQFIWSAIQYYKPDAMILYSPIKYWSINHLTDDYFIDTNSAYILNREYFHASEAGISLISWYKDDCGIDSIRKPNGKITFKPVDIDGYSVIGDGDLVDVREVITVKQAKDAKDTVNNGWENGTPTNERRFDFYSELDGTPVHYKNSKVTGKKPSKTSDNTLGYVTTAAATFDALNIGLRPLEQYNQHGKFLYKENAMNNLPYFAAACFEREGNVKWYEKSVYSRGKGKCEEFRKDKQFLSDVFVWSMLTALARGKSINGVVENNFCFDEGTWASEKYDLLLKERLIRPEARKLVSNFRNEVLGFMKIEASETADGANEETKYDYLMRKWESLGHAFPKPPKYDSNLKYNLYQIDDEINKDYELDNPLTNKPSKTKYYTVLSGRISQFKKDVTDFYVKFIKPKLIEYELVK